MKKLIRGIMEFHEKIQPGYRDVFARLALGQKPDALFVCCSDSRVAPNVFASTDPGDLFVIRNVGNLVPPCSLPPGHSGQGPVVGPGGVGSAVSVGAAIEFSLTQLNVANIIICGHSECGAMGALVNDCTSVAGPFLETWLGFGKPSLEKLHDPNAEFKGDPSLTPQNRLSQINVRQQIEHLLTYPVIRERVEAGKLELHGWWFDIGNASVHAYDPDDGHFKVINHEYGEALLEQIGGLGLRGATREPLSREGRGTSYRRDSQLSSQPSGISPSL